MQKNYRLILTLILCIISGVSIAAQDTVEYKDVVLDGKPAKLNVATGEITLVNAEDKKEQQVEEIVEIAKKETKVTSDLKMNHADMIAAESDFYIVQKGDNLLKLSERYNVSLRDLKNANNLETTLIRPGQKLRVKNFDAINENEIKESYHTSFNASSTNEHIVVKGETLYSLSKRYDMTVSDLKKKNNLTSNLIKIGQILKIGDYNESDNENNASLWIVSKGDTLYSIARKNGTTVDAIKQLNGLTSNLISIGQKLQLR